MPTQNLNKISENFCVTSAVAQKGTSEHNVHNYFPGFEVRGLTVGPSFAFVI